MRTTIITFVVALLLSFGSSFGNNNSKIYKNTETDKQNNTEITTVYKGKNVKNMRPVGQYVKKYDKSGNIMEQQICKWDKSSRSWVNVKKYIYRYNSNDEVIFLGYKTWNARHNDWERVGTYILYSHGLNDDTLVTDYIKTDKIQDEYISLK